MRSGCDRPATTRLAYDAGRLEVWLDELAGEPGPVQEVCDFHADRLTAPRGWSVEDRRAPRPDRSVLPSGRPSSTVATVPAAPSPGFDTGSSGAGPSQVLDDPATATPSTAGRRRRRSSDATPVEPGTQPGSLLSRAFRASGPQHSVLTQDEPDDDAPDRR